MSCSMAVNIGWEGGVYAQSCGHYLHLDCHKSYIQALSVCYLVSLLTLVQQLTVTQLESCSVDNVTVVLAFSAVCILLNTSDSCSTVGSVRALGLKE